MKELAIINPEHASEEEVKKYPVREAARAVIVDRNERVALLHVSKRNYYKLPGGGLEGAESKFEGLKRECLEEIGCDVEILGEIGSIVEYRKMFNLTQVSYCYLAKVKGEKGIPSFMGDEIADGFMPIWLSYEEARHALAQSKATTFEGSAYMVPRDTIFLEEAGNYLS